MLRTLQNGFLRPYLNGLVCTTSGGDTATCNPGNEDLLSSTWTANGTATHILNQYFARSPIIVGSASSADVAAGGQFTIGTAPTYRYLYTKTTGPTGTADDGTCHAIHVGFMSEDTTTRTPLQAVKNWARQPRLIGARIAADASITCGGYSLSASVASTNIYTITPRVAFGRAPVIVGTPIDATASSVMVHSTAASSIVAKTYTYSNTAAAKIFDVLILGWDANDEQSGLDRAVQVPQRKPRLIAGQVTGTGTAAITIGTGDFTLTDNGTGDYTLSWATAFADAPIVVCSAVGAIAQQLSAATTSEVNIGTFALATGNAADAVFYFIALGYDTAEEK